MIKEGRLAAVIVRVLSYKTTTNRHLKMILIPFSQLTLISNPWPSSLSYADPRTTFQSSPTSKLCIQSQTLTTIPPRNLASWPASLIFWRDKPSRTQMMMTSLVISARLFPFSKKTTRNKSSNQRWILSKWRYMPSRISIIRTALKTKTKTICRSSTCTPRCKASA